MSDVRGITGDQIVDCNDAMTFCQKSINQMRAEKTRTASDNRNGMRTRSHIRVYLAASQTNGEQETFVISSEVENGASGTSDMDGCAATVAARESADERVQISYCFYRNGWR